MGVNISFVLNVQCISGRIFAAVANVEYFPLRLPHLFCPTTTHPGVLTALVQVVLGNSSAGPGQNTKFKTTGRKIEFWPSKCENTKYLEGWLSQLQKAQNWKYKMLQSWLKQAAAQVVFNGVGHLVNCCCSTKSRSQIASKHCSRLHWVMCLKTCCLGWCVKAELP